MGAVLRIIWYRWENTVPNMITLTRFLIFLWGLHVFYWWSWNPWLIILLCGMSMGGDAIDGWAARTLGQHSVSGKILDPIVDKLCTWNGAVIIAHYLLTAGPWWMVAAVIFLTPPMLLIGVYDYMTMTMRGTDEEMTTNPVAKIKQAMLFTSLGSLMFAIAFYDLIAPSDDPHTVSALYITSALLCLCGTLMLWQTLRLTTKSARIYLEFTKSERAKAWSRVTWVKRVLAAI